MFLNKFSTVFNVQKSKLKMLLYSKDVNLLQYNKLKKKKKINFCYFANIVSPI